MQAFLEVESLACSILHPLLDRGKNHSEVEGFKVCGWKEVERCKQVELPAEEFECVFVMRSQTGLVIQNSIKASS